MTWWITRTKHTWHRCEKNHCHCTMRKFP